MRDIILALDPGQTTGWALIRRRDRAVLGMGDIPAEDLGCSLDLLVRAMHRLDHSVEAVVEQMPTPGGVGGKLATDLEFVRRTIDHWLDDIFELPITYVLPGVWKTSASARTQPPPVEHNHRTTSQHARDAYQMGTYHMRARR